MQIITVAPNSLSDDVRSARDFVAQVVTSFSDAPIVLDMSATSFCNPYGISLLLAVARHSVDQTGYKIRLSKLEPKVAAYLDRVDLFTIGENWLYTDDAISERFARSGASRTLVEISPLSSTHVQMAFLSRARTILHDWLNDEPKQIDDTVTVLSELCSNAGEHSHDLGTAIIQCYIHPSYSEVQIAVADLGIGIQKSLRSKYGSIGNSDEEYIDLALRGYSARGRHEGGAGLQMIHNRIKQRGGRLIIRSYTGLAAVNDSGQVQHERLISIPGTQVGVTLTIRGA